LKPELDKIRTILIIDDEPAHRMLVKRAIKALNSDLNVAEAWDLSSAKEALIKVNPVAVTLDLSLGRESGFDFLKWLRQLPTSSSVPVIVVTTSQLASDMTTAESLGADAYVSKNSDLQVNSELIQDALKKLLK